MRPKQPQTSNRGLLIQTSNAHKLCSEAQSVVERNLRLPHMFSLKHDWSQI